MARPVSLIVEKRNNSKKVSFNISLDTHKMYEEFTQRINRDKGHTHRIDEAIDQFLAVSLKSALKDLNSKARARELEEA